ncbi:DUF4885 domain-containing protein, partial [Pseudomonas sp. JG-B]|uniref:DUF4885 domain-containing protein n=1 Tax=Pseudomonas sp. JG-B TaxID=2603214 RepID=UPI001C49C89C
MLLQDGLPRRAVIRASLVTPANAKLAQLYKKAVEKDALAARWKGMTKRFQLSVDGRFCIPI